MNYLKTPVRDWKQNSPNEKAKREAAEAKERDLAKRNAFIASMREFLDTHGAEADCADRIIDYVLKKNGVTSFIHNNVIWTASRDCIRYHDYGGAFSFFDDGGGTEYFTNWALTFISNDHADEYWLEDVKLQDLNTYKKTCKESFYCKDSFGLKGVYEIHFDTLSHNFD